MKPSHDLLVIVIALSLGLSLAAVAQPRPLRAGRPDFPPPAASSGTLAQRVANDAGSTNAPLLFCIGMHIEPFGTAPSKFAISDSERPQPRPGAFRNQPPGRPSPGGKMPMPDYHTEFFFNKHIEDIRTVVSLVEKNGGKLTVQAQTPFTTLLAGGKGTLFAELEEHGHEVALHFHEDAHLGRNGGSLPVETWRQVMQEEVDWIRKAGATRVRYWSGGNLYPGVLDAAAKAGLNVMSDYKNPRTQKDDERLLSVQPWRPAAGPVEGDLAAFAVHGPDGKIIYLPNGVFERVDHSAMRRSANTGGDYPYFDALTRGLELSLKAARPDRVNVFHITVHAGEFRGGRGEVSRPFAVIDDWLAQVVVPLVKAGKVRWATFSQMAAAFQSWEKTHSDVDPRSESTRGSAAVETSGQAVPATPPTLRNPAAPFITFVVNAHDWGHLDESAATIHRLIGIFEKHKVRGEFYLTAQITEAHARKHPEVIRRLKESGMTLSYHVRAPHPLWPGFSESLRGLDDQALASTVRDYETYQLDLRTGKLNRGQPGGYAYVAQVFGGKPVAVGASDENPRVKEAALRNYAALGAQMAVIYHENGTDPDQPFDYRAGLLARPSDFSITRFALPGNPRGVFWWNMLDTPRAAEFDPMPLLKKQLAEWKGPRPPFITCLIHENDFCRGDGPGWNNIYFEGQGGAARPRKAPYDLNAPDRSRQRSAESRDAIFRKYEELVAFAAQNLRAVTSADIVALAKQAKATPRSDAPSR